MRNCESEEMGKSQGRKCLSEYESGDAWVTRAAAVALKRPPGHLCNGPLPFVPIHAPPRQSLAGHAHRRPETPRADGETLIDMPMVRIRLRPLSGLRGTFPDYSRRASVIPFSP